MDLNLALGLILVLVYNLNSSLQAMHLHDNLQTQNHLHLQLLHQLCSNLFALMTYVSSCFGLTCTRDTFAKVLVINTNTFCFICRLPRIRTRSAHTHHCHTIISQIFNHHKTIKQIELKSIAAYCIFATTNKTITTLDLLLCTFFFSPIYMC